jgi:hypothetical protein
MIDGYYGGVVFWLAAALTFVTGVDYLPQRRCPHLRDED